MTGANGQRTHEERDAILAEKIMGWTNQSIGWFKEFQFIIPYALWNPSRTINAANVALMTFLADDERKDWAVELRIFKKKPVSFSREFFVEFCTDEFRYYTSRTDESLALAITNALIDAVEAEGKKEKATNAPD